MNHNGSSSVPVAGAAKRRGRPPGSKNVKPSAQSRVANSQSTQGVRRRYTRKQATGDGSSVNVPSVNQLCQTDFVQESMDIVEEEEMDKRSLSTDQVAQQSRDCLRRLSDNLHGLESFQSEAPKSHPTGLQRTFYYQSSTHVVGEDVWPARTDVPCWHCRRKIEGVPMRHCRSIDWNEMAKKNVLKDVYGWWCNPQCLRRYLEQTNAPNIGHDFVIIARIIHLVMGMTMEETSGCAPPWQAHVSSGCGFMPDEEFKHASKASSQIRVDHLDKNILVPSIVVYEATGRPTGTGQDYASPLTSLGMDIDQVTGELLDTTVDADSPCDSLPTGWSKMGATGYAFQTIYSPL